MTSEFTVAVHSLVYLYHHSGARYSSEALAGNVCTNPARIRKVMGKLKKAQLVQTREGKDGGYFVEEDDGNTTLDEIGAALSVTFVAAAWKSGSKDLGCLIASGMGEVMDGLCDELNGLCRERLSRITIGEIDRKLTNIGEGTV